MAFELSPLPYDYNALEPYIDALTMQIHHDKHHAAYVTNLTKLWKVLRSCRTRAWNG